MNYSVSNTAEYGEYVSGPRVINEATRAEMKRILRDIQNGTFTSDWIRECKAGQPRFKATRRLNDAHQIEEIGAKLRAMMPGIKERALMKKSRNEAEARGARPSAEAWGKARGQSCCGLVCCLIATASSTRTSATSIASRTATSSMGFSRWRGPSPPADLRSRSSPTSRGSAAASTASMRSKP